MTGIERAVAAAKSQEALAEIAGVRQPAVSKWVAAGHMPLDIQKVARVSKATGVSVADLIPPSFKQLVRGN